MTEFTESDRLELYLGRFIMPRLNKIETDLGLLNKHLDDIGHQIKCRDDVQKELSAEIEKHAKILNGNGEEGMVGMVLRLIGWMEEQKKLQWFFLTTFISTAVGILVTLGYILFNLK